MLTSLGFFLSWWGAFVMGVLDSSLLFFLPLGIDAVLIYLCARNPEMFWLYPLMATAGSIVGAAGTFWIGRAAGDAGLERLVTGRRLERLRCRVRDSGAIALAVPALMPPPFPLTPFILTCGALDVSRWRFFGTFAVMRLLRFGLEGVLARVYGAGILRVFESDTFRMVVIGFVVIALLGTVASAVLLWRGSRRSRAYA